METIIGAIILIVIALWLIENVIWPLIKITAQISWYVGIIAGIVIISIGILFAFFVSIRAFIRALKNNINPYDTYIDKHPHTKGVKRGYFFGPGWHQIRSTWKASYSELFKENEKIERLAKSWLQNINIITFIFFDMWVYLFCGAALGCIYIFGSIWTFIFCSLLSIIVAIGALLFFICFTLLSISDRLALLINSIQSRCTNCKRIIIKPLFQCPKCNAIHNLTPGPYGIFHVECSCKNLLPTTAFNGRNDLTAICTKCRHTLTGYAEQFGIQLVGNTSSGKTTYLAALFHDYKKKMPNWVKCSYIPQHSFDTLEEWYEKGISTGTFTKNAEMYSIIHSLPLHAPYQFAMYDIAGEAFRDLTSTDYQQQQFQYSEGIILIIDLDNTPEDTQDTISSFISEYRNLKGINIERMNTTPTAIVISKADLYDELKGAYQEQDILKKFLFAHEFNSVMNFIEANFSNVKYFATSAMGHKPNDTSYNPIEVLNPVEWILNKKHSILFKILNRQNMAYEHLKFYFRKFLTFIPPFAMLALLTYGITNIPYDEISYQVGEFFHNIKNFSVEKDYSQNTLIANIPEEIIKDPITPSLVDKNVDNSSNIDLKNMTADELYNRAFQFFIPPNDKRTGIKQNNTEAVKLFTMAAELGHREAQFWLGHMYETGKGVRRNDLDAIKWWQKSADQGLALAQYWLARKYAKGQGVDKDEQKAIELWRKASREIPEAIDELKKLEIYAPADALLFNGHYYKVFYESLLWTEAKRQCEAKGGYLCTITSQEEFNFIKSILPKDKILFYWIGASDFENEGQWKWVTNEPFNFSYWRQGEPNGGRTENFLVMTNFWDNKWLWNDGAKNDWPSKSQYAYICEWENKSEKRTTNSKDEPSVIYASILGTQVNVRAFPTIDSASLIRLEEGTPINIIDYRDKPDGRWILAIMPNQEKGWIYAQYTQPRLGNKGEHGGEFMRINGDDVNLREAPDRTSSSITKLYKGHLVEIIDKTSKKKETWYKVYTLKGQKGWILGRYISKYTKQN